MEPSKCSCSCLIELVDLGGHPILPYLALVEPFVVLYPPVLVFWSNGTLLISMPWIIVKSLGSFNDLLKTIKKYIFNNIVDASFL